MKIGKSKFKGAVSILVVMLLLMGALPAYGSGLITIENSILPVLSLEISRQDPAVIGEEFTIVYLVKNISDKPAFNINYNFNIVGSDDLYPFTLTKPEPITQLDPGASATMSVKFTVDKDAREKTYRINGQVNAQDAGMATTVNYSAISDVPISFTTVKPNLTVTELKILEENPDTLEGFTVRLTLKNGSVIYDLRNILVQLEGGDNFEIMDITNKKEISKISANQASTIDFKIRSKEGRTTNTVTMTTSYNYTNGSVEDKKEELFIPIKEDVSTNGKKPQVIIKRYTLSKDQVLAGDKIDLTLAIENTNSRPVKNVLINFGVESTTSEGGGSSSSTVFAPVGSSNTFHVDQIKGKSTITNTITFAVDPGASAKTYIVPVTITYEDEKGLYDNLSIKDNVNIPVTQQAKMSVTSMTLPTNANVGMPTPVMAEFVNSGKVDLVDFTVKLEGDFETMDATVYLAKLSIGSTNSYTGMLIASEEGEKEGKLIVSYLDNNNQEVVEEYPFAVMVTAMEDMGPMDPDMFPPGGEGMPEDEGNAVVNFLKNNWFSVVLALAVAGQLIYIVRIKKKAKEEFFDE
ncbi:MAG: hypothetical protein AAGU12_14915 [Clostridiales bacterium]